MQKVLVLGNAAGGKTRLSKALARQLNLPVFHVDAIQFLPGMKLRALEETRALLRGWTVQERWIIDGYGPLDILEERMKLAERVYFVDLPIWRHYFWAMRRVFENVYSRRPELPLGCSEWSVSHIYKLFRTISRIHHKMRPQMLRILELEIYKPKVVLIRSVSELNQHLLSD